MQAILQNLLNTVDNEDLNLAARHAKLVKEVKDGIDGLNEENTGTIMSALAGSMCTTLSEILEKLKLEKYIDALLEAGYKDLGCFDFECTTFEEMLKELIEDVPMKKPPARKLLVHLRKQKQGTLNEQQGQVHVQDDIIALAEGYEKNKLINERSAEMIDLLFQVFGCCDADIKKLFYLGFDSTGYPSDKDNWEQEFKNHLDSLPDKHTQIEQQEHTQVARMTDEHAAIAASLNVPRRLVSNAAMAERNKRKVATSTGERKEQSGEEQSGEEQTRPSPGSMCLGGISYSDHLLNKWWHGSAEELVAHKAILRRVEAATVAKIEQLENEIEKDKKKKY